MKRLAEASKQTTLPKRMQLRNVLIGQSLVLLPWNCPMRPAAAGKYRLYVVIFFIDLSRQETDLESKQQLHFRQYQI